ncbi:MAG: pyocin activator PrtN family protein [Rhodobacterales bacterium]|nr:pyocin activator PrtN family protein [Rhodobacterales bacterium]
MTALNNWTTDMNLLPYTLMTILAFNEGDPLVDLEKIAIHYFNTAVERFMRKVRNGEISLPITEMEPGNRRSRKGVLVTDLANYLHERAEEARKLAAKRAA